LTVLDPSESLAFEPGAFGGQPIHRKYALQVWHSVRVPALDRWVECPVFHGPVWDMQRQGPEVSVTAHGWERQALGTMWRVQTFKKHTSRVRAIRKLMEAVGETRMSLPASRLTLPNMVTVARMDKPWPRVRSIARSMGRAAFYDGSGRFIVRSTRTRPAFTFDGRWLLADPKVTSSTEGLRNTFEVLGAKPKGGKPRPRGAVTATGDLSPGALGRHGEPHYLGYREENAHLKTRRECVQLATRRRDQQARGEAEATIEVLPTPFLDPYDLVHAVTADGRVTVRATRWTFPIGGDSPMSIGQVRRTVSVARRR
jgi:hypothetical protein